jgi:hypothetical protein
MNMVEILCSHVGKWNNRSVETVLRRGEGRIKENDREGEFN